MARKEAKALNKEFVKLADDLGLMDQKHFRQAVEAYNFQVELAEKLRARIKEEGTSIMVPAGKDGMKLASNPAIADLNKAEILAQKIRQELDTKIETAKQARAAELQKEQAANEKL